MIDGLVSPHRKNLPSDGAMTADEVRGLLDELSTRIRTVGRLS